MEDIPDKLDKRKKSHSLFCVPPSVLDRDGKPAA